MQLKIFSQLPSAAASDAASTDSRMSAATGTSHHSLSDRDGKENALDGDDDGSIGSMSDISDLDSDTETLSSRKKPPPRPSRLSSMGRNTPAKNSPQAAKPNAIHKVPPSSVATTATYASQRQRFEDLLKSSDDEDDEPMTPPTSNPQRSARNTPRDISTPSTFRSTESRFQTTKVSDPEESESETSAASH